MLVFVGFYNWRQIKEQGARMYWERKCLDYRVPAGTIFYSNDPQDLSALKSAPQYVTTGPRWPGGPYAIRPNRLLEKLTNCAVLPALFVHGRNAPSGPQRLVLVQMGRLAGDPFSRISLSPVNLQPLGSSGTTPGTYIRGLEMCLKPTDIVRLYCGQPDPNDASHFTIDYDLNGTRGTIDGKLTSGGTITLTPRSGRVVLLGSTSFWSPGGAPLPTAVEEELARLPATRPTR
jgi:hypothetical protein